MHRDTWLEIDLDAISSNVRTIKKLTGKKFIAVLKANAYGCGDQQIAQTVMQAGADMIAVSSLDEALVLRNTGYQEGLLILGGVNPEDVPIIKEKKITITVYSNRFLQSLIEQDVEGLKVHLKYDTGMNRIGFQQPEELSYALKTLLNHDCLVEGIFTHFACADSSREMTDRQFLKFAEAVHALNYPFQWIHCDNSDASISYKESVSNAVRIGISLYGISSYTKDLKQALSMYTKIFHVKSVKPGETVGYGATYTTTAEELIGTIPIGYADGFIRQNQGRHVYAEGVEATIVGRICMDQTMIRLPQYRPEGTVVELFGPHIPLETMAEELHTIPYEIICLINSRVTRRYISNGKVIGEDNTRLDFSSVLADTTEGHL